MQKAEVITQIAQQTGLSKADVKLMLEVLFQTIQEATAAGEKVHFRGFGSFGPKKRKGGIARNIAQNTIMLLSPHHIPQFTPAKAFVRRVMESLPVH